MALGNLFTALVNELHRRCRKRRAAPSLEGANYFWFFTAVMAVTARSFVVWSQFYRGRTYIQGEDGLETGLRRRSGAVDKRRFGGFI